MNQVYQVFSDESRHNTGRFRSIAAVSLPASNVKEISGKVQVLLDEYGVREFKWQKTGKGRERDDIAFELINITVGDFIRCGGRIDILTWDIHDSRHSVSGRDDIQNFERMFFHLHSDLMKRRENEAEWYLFPDERVDINWTTIQSCLGYVGRWRRYFKHPLLKESFSERFFHIKALREVESHKTPLCQMADFFAGIASYTRERAEVIKYLLEENACPNVLFPLESPEPAPSKRDRKRFKIVQYLNKACKKRKLGVSLKTKGFFHTRNPSKPLNFWPYKPQHEQDKAPTRTYHE